jgi:branched-subunit amino acid aminotransferase/4-amino-4-deoxychorismate lyase
MRRHLLETRATAEERIITLEDLRAADAILLCNSVRGLRTATSLSLDGSPASHRAPQLKVS